MEQSELADNQTQHPETSRRVRPSTHEALDEATPASPECRPEPVEGRRIEGRPRHLRALVPTLILLALALGAAVLAWFVNPAGTRWLPPCPLHAFTGLNCPGCGSTRALHYLVHGEPLAALRMNPLVVLAAPLIIYGLVCEVAALYGRKLRPISRAPWFAWGCLAVLLAFAVARNIPAYPFSLLAPH